MTGRKINKSNSNSSFYKYCKSEKAKPKKTHGLYEDQENYLIWEGSVFCSHCGLQWLDRHIHLQSHWPTLPTLLSLSVLLQEVWKTCVNMIELKSVSRWDNMPELPQYHSKGCLKQENIFHTALSRIRQKFTFSHVPGIAYILPYPQNSVDTADKLQHVIPLSVWACHAMWTDFDWKDLSGHSATTDRKWRLKSYILLTICRSLLGKCPNNIKHLKTAGDGSHILRKRSFSDSAVNGFA